MTNLFISLFEAKGKRQQELLTCLKHNLKIFDAVYCLTEGDIELPNNVIKLPVSCRPSFRTFFKAVNRITQPDDINIIANSDIYFKELPSGPKNNQSFALTRYEGDIFLNRADSQDTWIFTGEIKIPNYCDFWMGTPGCDNRIAKELLLVGYDVINPSLTIKTYHLHSEPTDHSKAVKRVQQPYFKPYPCTL